MDLLNRPFAHIAIDSVDTVAYDPAGNYDPERYDHYGSFVEARDAALSCVELLLHEGDFDGEDHREELERMESLLQNASTIEELEGQADYHWFLGRLVEVRPAA